MAITYVAPLLSLILNTFLWKGRQKKRSDNISINLMIIHHKVARGNSNILYFMT